MASLLNVAKGQFMHNKVGISKHRLSDVSLPEVNIVHVPRNLAGHPLDEQNIRDVIQRTGTYKRQAAAVVHDPEPTARSLTSGLVIPNRRLQQALHDDICQLILDYHKATEAVHNTGPPDSVHVKLEVLQSTPCPRWHADHVAARLLVTYAGPGTWYVPNKAVRRSFTWTSGAMNVAVADVDESTAVQAGAGDLLLLKGHGWPGCWGLGAVHRSPLVEHEHEHEDQQAIHQHQQHQHGQIVTDPSSGTFHQDSGSSSETGLIGGPCGCSNHHNHDHRSQGMTGGNRQWRLLLTIDDAELGWQHRADHTPSWN